MINPLDENTRTALVRLLLPDLREAIARHPEEIGEIFEEIHPADGADLLSLLDDEEVRILLQHLDPAESARLLEYVEPATAARWLEEQRDEHVADIVEEMEPDDRVELLAEFEEEEQEKVLAEMQPEEREDVEELLSHEEGTAGRLMNPQFVTVPAHGTAEDALARARAGAREDWNIAMLYVVDEKGTLRGRVPLVEVLKAEADASIDSLTQEAEAVRVDTDQESVAQVISKYDLVAVPVVDLHGRIVGIVTVDDVVDILTEEATEDAQRQGAMQPLENSYFQTGFWEMVRKRGVWLLVLFLAELFTASALEHFDHVLKHALTLVFFIPLIVSSGGNSGSQSASLITRALAVGEVSVRDVLRIAGREMGMGVALGLALGIVGYVRVLVAGDSPLVCATVALTLVGVVAIGAMVGAMLPLLFKRIGLDPAITSSPFVASIVDVTGIVLYLSIARLIMGI